MTESIETPGRFLIAACIQAAAVLQATGHADAPSCIALARDLFREATREPWKHGVAKGAASAVFRQPSPTDLLYAEISGDQTEGAA